MSNHKQYSAYIFDMDNTLYDETKYLFPAFFSIARQLDNEFHCGYLNLCSFLKNTFIREGRQYLFDKLMLEFGFPLRIIDVCVKQLRSVTIEEKINLYDEMEQCLNKLIAAEKQIFILTNGNIHQQKNKVAHINWKGLDEKINFYYAAEIEPKPSPAGLLKIIADHHLKKNEVVFVGDDEVDLIAANAASIDFIYADKFNCIIT